MDIIFYFSTFWLIYFCITALDIFIYWLIRARLSILLKEKIWIADLVYICLLGILTLLFGINFISQLWRKRLLPGSLKRALDHISITLVFWVSKIFNLNKDRARRAYIELNNRTVFSQQFNLDPEKILVLLPHCLQWSDCPVKITGTLKNCRACGKCFMHHLLKNHSPYLERIKVATGGTLARRYVQELQPRAVIAVACERDLMAGILDIQPLPVIGVLLQRPNGPCRDTQINPDEFEAALNFLLKTA